MKKIVLHLLIILGTLICNPLKAQESSFDPNKLKLEYFNDKKVTEGKVFDDKKGNTFKVNNSDTKKGLFIKKKEKWVKHGVWYQLSEGRVTLKEVYKDGKLNGLRQRYHKNGKVAEEYNYVNGVKEGMGFKYSADGSKLVQTPYKSGKKEGQLIRYHTNGKIRSKIDYKNGDKHGEQLQYNSNGKLVSRSQYNLDKKVGKTQYYY